jgi:DnaK suppressor protein
MTKAIDKDYYSTEECTVQSVLSQDELSFFKKELEKQKRRIESNLNISSSEMDDFINYDPKDEGDYASIALEQSLGSKLSDIQAQNLLLIEKSLKKIEHNCYGICTLCEEPIRTERLKVKVFAEYCISCREIIEKELKQ